MKTTFLVPSFNKSDPHKVNNAIDVTSPNILVKSSPTQGIVPAISSEGFPANRDGTYIFVARIEKTVGDAAISFGFSCTGSVDANSQGAFPGSGMAGVCYFIPGGELYGGNGNRFAEPVYLDYQENPENWSLYFFSRRSKPPTKEIICILTISTIKSKNNGFTQHKKTFQVIVNGKSSDVFDLPSSGFENRGNLIYPTVSLFQEQQKIEFIAFDQVKSRSPQIEELMKEFLNAKTNKAKEDEEKSKKKTEIKKAPKKTKEGSSTTTVAKTKTKKDTKEKAPTKKKTAKKETTPTKKTGKTIAKK